MTKKKTDPQDASSNVKIVDGKLILSLPNAQMPVVWQMDLENAQSSSFTVVEDKKAKNFTLILKGQDGTVDEIAPFDDKQSAVDVLMETSSVLQNAHGQIRPGSTSGGNTSNNNDDKDSDKLGAGLAIALAIVLILIWVMMSSVPNRSLDGASSSTNTSGSATNNSGSDPRQSSGVPVSADDFLNNR